MKTKHGSSVIPALAPEALFAKSRVYVKRGLTAKQDGDDQEFQLWAALALEVLGKASLAGIHPSLVVLPDNPNSLLEASGVKTGTAVKTIAANEVYARLKHTVKHFGTPVFDDCKKLAERRNAELHSGDAAFAAMPPSVWEGAFWNAAELILESMDRDLDNWLGSDAKTPKEILKATREAKKEAAKERIKHARVAFMEQIGKNKRKSNALREASLKFNPYDYGEHFRYVLSKNWLHECPACDCLGTVGGDLTHENRAEDQSSADFGFEIIEKEYAPVEFYCPTCGLSLAGDEALTQANITEPEIETDEQEIEYEPDYGND